MKSEPLVGTVVKCFFPSIEKPKAKAFEPKLKTGEYSASVLFVDDEQIVKLNTITMKDANLNIHGTTDPTKALELFKAAPQNFDIIVTDYNMDKMNGIELASEISTIKPDIPIILCTGFSDTVDSKLAETMGVNALIHKPLIPDDLIEKINTIASSEE